MTIKYIKEINEPTKIDIIIPAAGLGRRMKSYGPKPLIQIKPDHTILDNQLRIIKKILPNACIILVCGFEAIRLMNSTPDQLIKIENENYESTNVARSIGMGLRACMNDALIIYGDLVFNEQALKAMNFNKSSILVGDHIMEDSEVGCIVNKKGYIENMMYDLKTKWGQIAFFKGRELKLLKQICWDNNNYGLFGFEVINQIMSKDGRFLGCTDTNIRVIDIDSSKDLEKVSQII